MTKFILELSGDKCFDCPMCRYGLSDCCAADNVDRFIDDKSTRPEWCQLVPEEEYIELAFCVSDQCQYCDEYGASCNGAFRLKEFTEEE